MTYRSELLAMVLRLASGELSVPQFQEMFYDYYIEKVPDDAMADRDYEFFGTLQQKLDWTDPAPLDEDRLYGWINHEEYVAWAKGMLEHYLAGSATE
jgi:hypothetical protein